MGGSLSQESFSKLFIYRGDPAHDPTFRFKTHHVVIMGIVKMTKNGEEKSMIHLRNPWAKFDYRGPFRMEDSFWTEEVKKQLPLEYNKFGSIYIDADSFVNFFKSFTVSHYHESWMTSYN